MSRIHLSKADVTEVEERYVLAAMRSGWIAAVGPDVDALECEIAGRVGVQGAVALSSGTAALHLSLAEVGARPGTVVLVPSMTFVASANAVRYTGAEPVFVDSQASDGNVDPQLLVDAVDTLLAEGTPIAAVMTVDLFGRCCDYELIESALAERGVPLIADAAEALGASYQGRRSGSFGAATVFSFNGNKIMTTTAGGMIVSNDLYLIERCRYLSLQARQPLAYYEHTEMGYNYRMSNILAALGRAQLSRLDEMISRRRYIRHRYRQELADLPGLRFLGQDAHRTDAGDNCWLTSLVLDPHELPVSVDTLIKQLAAEDVEARQLWKPMHLQPMFEGTRAFINGTSQSLFFNGLSLPNGSALTDSDIDRVVDVFRAALEDADRNG